ncbi:MAG: DUF2851 family protein [Ignavibacteriae bacterium]|nr:DUF2851 family protein [Ignavibacteriota bacterium]MCB9216058.1 DUF2851 family protein [Ignavibacteria bacterium]
MPSPIQSEAELYTLWNENCEPGVQFKTLHGTPVTVISPGQRNRSSGPDFLNAVLLIDGNLTVGHVEMHLRESDWFAHNHQHDSAYESVILHVLAEVPDPVNVRLSIPTIGIDQLSEVGRGKVPENSSSSNPLPLLAELSWHRFLRRATEAIRREPHLQGKDQIEREFLIRLFDSLGYSANRLPMKRLAERVFANRQRILGADFDQVLGSVLSFSALPVERLARVAADTLANGRLRGILPEEYLHEVDPGWNFRGRPANAPERRVWAGAKLTFDLFNGTLLEEAFQNLRERRDHKTMRQLFLVPFGKEMLVGNSRADEIVVNALLPTALAAGVLQDEVDLIEGACLCYRNAPSLSENNVLRSVEQHLMVEGALQGAFFQQGGIEFFQRFLNPDKSNLSMVAEE